ncbi:MULTISPECIES: S8 family peptidase [unclassified Stenotrophomonas]|uniref:S8 family peptidase n=1 Tax=unclassified Stenotrophomonas TaxID=196198 RepID=UPI002117B93C|nr:MULTISPECIES: S8 family peptidase [unclassified Stenotrophomonas]
MAEQTKFLLGLGETLSTPGFYPKKKGSGEPPYTIDVQRSHLAPMLEAQADDFDWLPDAACPEGNVVSMVTLHPSYYSRSAFPGGLIAEAGLRFVGSMPAFVKPRRGRGHDLPGGAASTTLFLAGKRESFHKLAGRVAEIAADDPLAKDVIKIEHIEPQTRRERIQTKLPKARSILEVVMHYDPLRDFTWEEQFNAFAAECGLALSERSYQARGLWFLEAVGTAEAASKLADFSFVRAIRPMPKIRPVEAPKVMRSSRITPSVILPADGPVDPDCRVAVFDGGLPLDHPFKKWASRIEPTPGDEIGDATDEGMAHGMAVTSALLFGHMKPGLQVRPYCHVDHYRCIGEKTTDRGLYSVMLYIEKVLSSTAYEFVSLSIGPEEITGPDKISAWTTLLDDHFHQSSILGTIAVGNDGDQPAPHNRIQIPSDCVNALAIGASDSNGPGWRRAPYSSIGPGRSPGLVKPDLVHFGGVDKDRFGFLFPGGHLVQSTGTSFATPAVMRMATAVRAHFGRSFTPLAVRALLIHASERGEHPRQEVGWGLAPSDIADITVCADNSVRILYLGKLDPSKVRRVPIPVPESGLSGKITIRATFCYLCETDPNSPGDYTRAGLGVTFRPHAEKFKRPSKPKPDWKPDPKFPASDPFFEGIGANPEQALRSDSLKWDTVRDASLTKLASSLKRPVFDVHYMAREPGRSAAPAHLPQLSYALVVTVSSTRHPDIYERVLEAYSQLKPLLPIAELPATIPT